MAADVLEIEEVTFTLVTNKKYKRKGKVSFLSSMFWSDSRSKTSLISWALPFSNAVTAHLVSKLVITYPDSAVTSSF